MENWSPPHEQRKSRTRDRPGKSTNPLPKELNVIISSEDQHERTQRIQPENIPDQLRRLGLWTIPVRHKSKAAALPKGHPFFERRATDEEHAAWSYPGVGIVTGRKAGVLVLDVDGPQGAEELKRRGHPPTWMVRTQSGGMHVYFKHPDCELRTRIRAVPDLDLKAGGGYVVAPPSAGPKGMYEWIVSPEDAELADAPEWLVELDRRDRFAKAGPVGEEIGEGKRNHTLASLAGTMRRRGMCEAEIFGALEITNRLRCKPPLSEDEVRGICASVARYETDGRPWWVRVVKKNV